MNKMSKVKEIAAAVRAQRKQRGLTQVQLAELCNTGERFIVELESGRKETLSLGTVLKVLSRLGLDFEIKPRGRT